MRNESAGQRSKTYKETRHKQAKEMIKRIKNEGGFMSRSGAARQSENTKTQEKVKRDDQGMLRHAVKRCKTSQVMRLHKIGLTSARHAGL